MTLPSALTITLLCVAAQVAAKDISGPQVGEEVTSFTIRGVLDDEAGKSIDLVKDAAGRPLIIFFVHERTRPSIMLARQVLNEAANRKGEGLEAGLVLLTPDVAATEEWVKIASQSLPRGVTVGVSPDGSAGPPAYNLNSKVIATVVIAKKGRVVANFALTQPSPSDDAPKIAAAISTALEKP